MGSVGTAEQGYKFLAQMEFNLSQDLDRLVNFVFRVGECSSVMRSMGNGRMEIDEETLDWVADYFRHPEKEEKDTGGP